MIKNKINFFIYFILFFTFLINFFIINHFNNLGLVAFISNDEIYLIEQLLIKIKKNYIAFNADIAEYGIEFIYFSKIISFFDLFFEFKEITIYKIITTIHLLFFVGLNLLILKLFDLLKINNKLAFLIISFNCLNTIFIQSFTSLKPDFNIVYFFIILSFYFLIQFNLTSKIRFLNISIFCSSIAFCIKIWGFIMIIPIIFCLIKYKKKNYEFFPYKNFLLFSIILFLYFLYFVNSFENYFFNHPEYSSIFQNIILLKNFTFFDIVSTARDKIFLISFIFLLYLFFLLLLFRTKKKKTKINLPINVCLKFVIFSSLLLIPYVVDFEKLIKSVFFFSNSFIFVQNFNDIFYLNFLKIFKNFLNINYIYLISYVIIFKIYIKFVLKKSMIFSNEFLIFFIASTQIFIFYLAYKKFNIGSNISISLLLAALIILLNDNKIFFENKKKYYLVNIIAIIVILFSIKSNFINFYYNQITSFKKINLLKNNIN